jgi:hypothetical protein
VGVLTTVAIAVVTALATALATRWLDDRRGEAQGRREVAAELRTHLAAAHRAAIECSQAFDRAWSLLPPSDDEDVLELHDAVEGPALEAALDAFDAALAELRGRTSEIVVRVDPTIPGPVGHLTTVLNVGGELSRWLRRREVPQDWGDHEQDFLLRSRDLLETTPWLLAQSAAVLAAPDALEPRLRSIRRRAERGERRAVRRQWWRAQLALLTGGARRERRRLEAHRAALLASVDASRTDGSSRPDG